jgi:glycerol-3-phosphate acyltransferase PlsY
VKEIFQGKSFWFILIILLFGACVYPPFRLITEVGITTEPKWEFILTALPTLYVVPEIDLEMLLVEVIMAIPLAIAISLVFYSIKTALRRLDDKRLRRSYLNRRL